ncbi:MAG: hypothetical protein QM296_07670 [Bacillota bacterium]|nr:hypothetical protein [Bacillota bacterium]
MKMNGRACGGGGAAAEAEVAEAEAETAAKAYMTKKEAHGYASGRPLVLEKMIRR